MICVIRIYNQIPYNISCPNLIKLQPNRGTVVAVIFCLLAPRPSASLPPSASSGRGREAAGVAYPSERRKEERPTGKNPSNFPMPASTLARSLPLSSSLRSHFSFPSPRPRSGESWLPCQFPTPPHAGLPATSLIFLAYGHVSQAKVSTMYSIASLF